MHPQNSDLEGVFMLDMHLGEYALGVRLSLDHENLTILKIHACNQAWMEKYFLILEARMKRELYSYICLRNDMCMLWLDKLIAGDTSRSLHSMNCWSATNNWHNSSNMVVTLGAATPQKIAQSQKCAPMLLSLHDKLLPNFYHKSPDRKFSFSSAVSNSAASRNF